ncbi:MAG TPA: sulfotransferase, partial [Acidimicrobiia bacterium]
MADDELITIDDLAEPKLDAAQRAALDYVSRLDVRFDADTLLRDAQARTGYSDFGDPGFRARLDMTIAAVEAD